MFDSVKRIGRQVFSCCSKLHTVRLPKGLVTLNMYTFSRCESLESIDIPASVRTIKEGTFSNCTKLRNINTDNNCLEDIEAFAFAGCKCLESIKISCCVKEIPKLIFYQCNEIEVSYNDKTYHVDGMEIYFTESDTFTSGQYAPIYFLLEQRMYI